MTGGRRGQSKDGVPGTGVRRNGQRVTTSQTKSTKPKLPDSTRRFAEARKSGERLLPQIERYLLTVADDRGNDNLLHVSDICKSTWCPRMLFYRMTGVRPQLEVVSFQLRRIFDYGSTAHLKYQGYWHDMGVLFGRWKCGECGKSWLGMSPESCVRCGLKSSIKYMEVPLADPDVLLIGNSDAEVRDSQGNVLVECKTVAEGTFRVEAPKLLGQYTRTVTLEDGSTEKHVDIVQLWRDLRRPLPSHSRQGQTYVALRKKMKEQPPVDGIVFLYESKNTQAVKEFFVEEDESVASEVLGRAADVAFAVTRGVAPRCLDGKLGCALCQPYEAEWRRNHGNNTETAGQATAGRRRRAVIGGSKRLRGALSE